MSDIEKIKKLIEEHKKYQAEGNEHFLYYTQGDLDKALVNAESIEETKLLLSGGANPNKRNTLGENKAFTHAQSIEQMQALVDAGAEITNSDFRDCMWYNRGGEWKEKCHFLLSHQVDNNKDIPTWNSMFDYVGNPINVNPDVWYAGDLESRWKELATMEGRERDKMRRQGEQIKNEACSSLGIDVKDVRYCKRIGDVVQIDYYTNHTDGHICLATVYDNKFTKIGECETPSGYGPIEDFYALEPLGKNLYATFSGIHDGLLTGSFSYIGTYGTFITINKKGIEDGITIDSLPDAVSYIQDQKHKSFLLQKLKEQLLQRYPDKALQKSDAINLSKSEIMDCISQTDYEFSIIEGLKTYGKEISKEDASQTIDEKSKLIALINNDMNDKIEVDENRLSDLKGVSVKDLADGYSETALLAAQVYDCSHLSGLLQVAVEAPNTPASDLIAARYRETYGSEIVDGITECADEIIKLPYKKMFFETITKDNSNAPEANFLDAFTDKIRDLAMKKYGQEDWYTSISEAAKNPEFMKECDNVWEEMFAEADKYATYRPNEHNNAYIRQMFSDKAEQLHEFVTTQKIGDFAEVLDETIKYHQKVGKMMAALREYSKDNEVSFNGNLHFDLVDAGIETKKEAKRCLDIWQSANERPDRYGSPYNEYSVRQIAQIAKSNVMQDWMYPVMMDAIEKGGLTMSEGRMPSERTLFDCCKAWKINPAMPQRLAKFVGTQSLKGRMLAGAIFDKMVTDGKTTPEEWRDNKVLHEKFYEELARAEKMPREKAFQQYIPNTPVNRKRVIGMGMEEKGIENTPENFKALYREAREQGVFEKLLAKPEEARTTFSSRLLVETARRKAARE